MKTVSPVALFIIIWGYVLLTDCISAAFISTGILNAICNSLRSYAAANKLVLKLERSTAGKTSSQWHIRWNKCAKPGKQCTPFSLEETKTKYNQEDSDVCTPAAVSATVANKQEKLSKPLSIIVTLKSQQSCLLPEFPKSSISAHSQDITPIVLSLQEHARKTQKGIIDLLETKARSKTLAYDRIDALWLINVICIRGASLNDVKQALGGHPDVHSVRNEEILTVMGGSSVPGNKYDLYSGTSMASPHVAGVVALMLQKDPTLTFDTVKEILESTASKPANVSSDDISCGDIREKEFPNNAVGYGLVNAPKAMKRIKANNN